MNQMRHIALLFIILFYLNVNAQIGAWHDYFSFNRGMYVEQANDKIYVASEKGLYYFDTVDNSINKLSKIQGLSDVAVTAIRYNDEQSVMIVGYENGNLDLIFEDDIVNISDIKRASIIGDHRIYAIQPLGEYAFLACGFGVVKLNIAKREIAETYYIGNNGAKVGCYDLTLRGDQLYVASENGLYQANYVDSNLLDFREWQHVDNIPNSSRKCSIVKEYNNQLLVAQGNSTQRFYVETETAWKRVLQNVPNFYSVNIVGQELMIVSPQRIRFYNHQYSEILSKRLTSYNTFYFSPRDAHLMNNQLWVADWEYGMMHNSGTNWNQIIPHGPNNNKAFGAIATKNSIWFVDGGKTAAWGGVYNRAHLKQYQIEDEQWISYDFIRFPELNTARDFIEIAVDPNDEDHVYIGSWGYGLFEFNNGELIDKYTSENTDNAIEQVAVAPQLTRIGGVGFDKEGQLWVTTSEVTNNRLAVRRADQSWESFRLTQHISNPKTGRLLVTSNNQKWIQLFREGLYVIGDMVEDQIKLNVTVMINETQKVLNNVQCLAEDLEGEIWVGTTQGVVVYPDPTFIFEEDRPLGYQPAVDSGDDYIHPLLGDQTVTAIAVDDANRKWIGTDNSGVYLVTADGTEVIEHFNVDNSFLPHNNILSITIHSVSGKVFLGTQNGVVSYNAAATAPASRYNNVYAYPNPVRESYHGNIIIKGLTKDTNVKIVDVSGNLVTEVTSLGGQAIWDGKNMNGRRVATGVYYIMVSNSDGTDSAITKLLFIH